MKTLGQDTPALGHGTSVVSMVCAGDNGCLMRLDEGLPESGSRVFLALSCKDFTLLAVNPRIRVPRFRYRILHVSRSDELVQTSFF